MVSQPTQALSGLDARPQVGHLSHLTLEARATAEAHETLMMIAVAMSVVGLHLFEGAPEVV